MCVCVVMIAGIYIARVCNVYVFKGKFKSIYVGGGGRLCVCVSDMREKIIKICLSFFFFWGGGFFPKQTHKTKCIK